MASGLEALGYRDYRRSDAVVVRMLSARSMSVGKLGEALGVTRQAARKVVRGLEQRGLATTERDRFDARQVMVVLTTNGKAYERALSDVIDRLNGELTERVDRAHLAATDSVLRAVLDERFRSLAARIEPPAPG